MEYKVIALMIGFFSLFCIWLLIVILKKNSEQKVKAVLLSMPVFVLLVLCSMVGITGLMEFGHKWKVLILAFYILGFMLIMFNHARNRQ
jgi:hypothetical protein